MARRWIRNMVWMIAALLTGLASTACASSPATRQPHRIVAVGDLHGDYKAWMAIARDAGLVDERGHWIGGKTTLVQLGDIVDRGPASLPIIRSLQLLQREAKAAGGQIIVVLGNHEAMNVLGDVRYVSEGEYASFADVRSSDRRDRYFTQHQAAIAAAARASDPKATDDAIRAAWIARTPLGWVEHGEAWAPAGPLGRWATANPAIVKIGPYLFVHGGISAETAATPIETVNRAVGKAMAARLDGAGSLLNDPLGPLWYRGNVGPDADAEARRPPADRRAPRPSREAELDQVLAAYGARHLIVAHTPNPKGILISPDSKLVRIDTAISIAYGGTLSWLDIVGGTMTPHVVARPAP